MLNRREVLYALGAFMLTASAGCSRPETKNPSPTVAPTVIHPPVPASPEPLPIQSEKFTVPELQKLGKELEEWRLANGRLAVEVFPYIKPSINMLKGQLDPRVYIPPIHPPITFDGTDLKELGGQLRLVLNPDDKDSRTITIITPRGLILTDHWLKADTSLTIAIDKSIMGRTVRMVFAEKEIRQLIDMPLTDSFYLKWAKEQGVKFSPVINPDNIPFTTREYEFNCAARLRNLEFQYNNGISYLEYLIDIGSYIRSGIILYVNWSLEQLSKGKVVPEQEPWSQRPMGLITHLINLKLLKESGGVVTWAAGQPPEVGSPSFNQVLSRIMTKEPQINF